MKYPNLSNIVSYKAKDYEVVTIEYDPGKELCLYHLKRENSKIVVDVKNLDCNNKYRNET